MAFSDKPLYFFCKSLFLNGIGGASTFLLIAFTRTIRSPKRTTFRMGRSFGFDHRSERRCSDERSYWTFLIVKMVTTTRLSCLGRSVVNYFVGDKSGYIYAVGGIDNSANVVNSGVIPRRWHRHRITSLRSKPEPSETHRASRWRYRNVFVRWHVRRHNLRRQNDGGAFDTTDRDVYYTLDDDDKGGWGGNCISALVKNASSCPRPKIWAKSSYRSHFKIPVPSEKIQISIKTSPFAAEYHALSVTVCVFVKDRKVIFTVTRRFLFLLLRGLLMQVLIS